MTTNHDMVLDHIDEIERLEAALQDSIAENTRLRTALTTVAKTHAWLAFGDCRVFDALPIATPSDAHKVAIAALGETK